LAKLHYWPVVDPGPDRQRAGKPLQVSEQQSGPVVQGAPVGAQASRQASFPEVLGVHTPEQQSAARAQGRPAIRQAATLQCPSLSHRVPLQHSDAFLHGSPADLHPGASAQRSTPSGTLRHVPEQQSSFDWQRSSLGKQPPAPWQRPSLPQLPEQQLFASVQRSAITLHPGRALQVPAPLAAT
jgi:hypothetical protein